MQCDAERSLDGLHELAETELRTLTTATAGGLGAAVPAAAAPPPPPHGQGAGSSSAAAAGGGASSSSAAAAAAAALLSGPLDVVANFQVRGSSFRAGSGQLPAGDGWLAIVVGRRRVLAPGSRAAGGAVGGPVSEGWSPAMRAACVCVCVGAELPQEPDWAHRGDQAVL